MMTICAEQLFSISSPLVGGKEILALRHHSLMLAIANRLGFAAASEVVDKLLQLSSSISA